MLINLFLIFIIVTNEIYVSLNEDDNGNKTLIKLLLDAVVEIVKTKSSSVICAVKNLCFSFGYNMMYLYSVCQIYLNKVLNLFKPLLTNKEESLVYKSGAGNLMIVLDKTNNNKVLLKEPVVSTIAFVHLEINYNSKTYTIELKNDNHNYYIVGNALDKDFFKHYLSDILKVSIDKGYEEFNYIITLMDHNVNMLSLNQNQTILIEKNGYKVLTSETGPSETGPSDVEDDDFANVYFGEDEDKQLTKQLTK
jgi:hypothetical protein